MKDLRSSRRLIQRMHRRDKATIDHLVRSMCDGAAVTGGTVHPPITSSGLIVEEQVRKAWEPRLGGLPIF